MDLPLILEERKVVEGVQEKNQQIYCHLKQVYGTILQDVSLGNNIPFHVVESDSLNDYISYALSNIEGVNNVQVRRSGNEFQVTYLYQGTQQLFIIPEDELM